MQGRARRILLLSAGAVAVWYLVVLATWAARPLSDTVPIGTNPVTQVAVSQEVECNTLFSGSARDGDLPTLPVLLPLYGDQFEYNRAPCDLVQRDARIVFGIDTLGAVVIISGLLYVATRRPADSAPILPADRATYA